MPCGVLALIHQWLSTVGAYVLALDSTLRHIAGQTLQTVTSATRLLLSFESLIIVSFLTFFVLGSALTLLLFWTLCHDEYDEYDDCETGVYYADRDGRWMGVAVPVIVVDRNMRTNPESSSAPKHGGGKRL